MNGSGWRITSRGNSERRRWQEETRAGNLTKLLPPVDEAAELAEAKRQREHREYCYETEPPPPHSPGQTSHRHA